MRKLFSISIALFSFYLMLFSPHLPALNLKHNSQDFALYQRTLSKESVQEKIKKMLQKDPEVENWYKITDHALKIYASLEDKKEDSPEFTLLFGSMPKVKKEFPKLDNPHAPLKGLRIAIDPGHIGGEFAYLEEKYIQMPINPLKNIHEELSFNEGDLTIRTAKKLAQHFETLGAKVLLTKSNPGEVVYKKPFDLWLKENFNEAIDQMVDAHLSQDQKHNQRLWWKEVASAPQIFRMTYNFLDVERRAELINAFNPHVTISCHYNLGGIYDKEGLTPGVDFDYALFFVPGAFKNANLKNEAFAKKSLQDARSRYEFIRFIVTDDLESSIDLAKTALGYTKKILKSSTGDDCSYLKVLCIQHEPGIYHNNLTLPKLVHGPVLYGEPLCQDNYANAKMLSSNPDYLIDKVVQIYSRSVLDWAESFSDRYNDE